MSLYGEILTEPKLRFDYSSTFAEGSPSKSKRCLLTFGPYDSNLFGKSKINCVLIYPTGSEKYTQILIDGLIKGEGGFRGFQSFFKVPLNFLQETAVETDIKNFTRVLESVTSTNPDIVFVLLEKRKTNLYGQAKAILLANGIPSQMVTIEQLSYTPSRRYVLENICLACYAKIGGVPWVISTSELNDSLVLGVSRAEDPNRGYLVGFVTLFTQDGDFLFMNSKAPVIKWEEYVKGLSKLIEDSISEFETLRGIPNSIIIHFHKRPGWKEIDAIEMALKNVARNIPYAIIHLNEYSNFRLFDSSHISYIPPKGFKVNLSTHEALLLLDGRIGDRRHKIGIPRVLDVRMDKRSTLDVALFPKLVEQIYNFSYINWRGFNAAAIPITLNYSKLIARMVIETGIEGWNQIIAGGKLRDKAWFL